MIPSSLSPQSAPQLPQGRRGLFAFDKEKWSFSGSALGLRFKILPGQKKNYKNLYRIAIIAPVRTPLIQDLQRQFTDTLRNNSFLDYQFTVYNAHCDYEKLPLYIEEIAREQFDLLYTIGASATKVAQEITAKTQSKIPVVFSNVHQPVQRNFVASEKNTGNNLTGIKTDDMPSYSKQIELLAGTQNISSISILWGPFSRSAPKSDLNELDVCLLQKKYAQKNIEIIGINSSKFDNNFEQLANYIEHSDVFMPLRNGWAASNVSTIASLCNRFRTIFFPSSLSSLRNGAAIAYGPTPVGIEGKAAAQKVMAILEEQKNPSEIPVSPPNYRYELRVNPETMHLQGLKMTSQLRALLERGTTP